jgi:hypothetical protein
MGNPKNRQGGKNVKSDKVSPRVPDKSPLQRISELEGNHQMLLLGLQEIGNQVGKLTGLTEVLEQIAGVENVQQTREQIREAKDEAQREIARKSIEEALKEGRLRTAGTITEDSLIVGRELDQNGEVLRPGRIQVQVKQFSYDEIKEFLIGKSAGCTWRGKIKEGERQLVVDEIYDFVASEAPAEENSEASE